MVYFCHFLQTAVSNIRLGTLEADERLTFTLVSKNGLTDRSNFGCSKAPDAGKTSSGYPGWAWSKALYGFIIDAAATASVKDDE